MGQSYLSAICLRRPLPEDSYLRRLGPVRYLMEGNPLKFDSSVTFLVGENGTGKSTLLEAIAVVCGFNPEGGTRNFTFSTRNTHSVLVGENGTGKSTLLEAIAVVCGFNPEGGTRNFTFSTRNTHSVLGEYLTPGRRRYPKDGFFLRAESFYNVATNIDQIDEEPGLGGRLIDSYGGVSLHQQSHGESFLALVQNRFGGHGLYLLDEPEAALSPSRLLTLLGEMHQLVGEDSQFIVATHSPILMAYPNARIYELSSEGIRTAAYRETEHYQLTKQFLEAPERMLRYLLED